MNQILIIDTETTGLTEPELIEYGQCTAAVCGGVLTPSEVEVSRWKPSKPIEFGAMATHGIMDEDLANCPESASFKFETTCDYLAGHNIDYDWEVVGKPDIKRICTLALARSIWPDTSHKLMALMFMLDRTKAKAMHATAHGVATDIEATFELLKMIMKIKGPKSWSDLYRMSEEARIPTVIPFGKHKGTPIKSLPSDYVRWLLGQSDLDPYLVKALKS